MVCVKSTSSELIDSLKNEVLSHYEYSSINKNPPFPSDILILEPYKSEKWEYLSPLTDLKLTFADSIHSLIRSGFYQNFILFGVSDDNPYLSPVDFEAILQKRSKYSLRVFEYSKLSKMKPENFANQLAEVESDYRINHAVNHILKNRDKLNSHKPSSESINETLLFDSIRNELKVFLKNHVGHSKVKPEQTLKKAISLIRPQS